MLEVKRKNSIDIRNAVTERRIKRLVHFTSVDNLESIFKHGLLSVKSLDERKEVYYYNDEERIDNCLDAICLSIQRPNYSTFWRYRLNYPSADWVVLGIKKRVLWKKDCAFCVENAAHNNVRFIPIEDRKGLIAFNRLFEEYPGKPLRKELNIGSALPTHPQAEVLVFDRIEQSEIFGIAFENNYKMNKYKHLVPEGVSCQVQKWLFEPRKDYVHWQR